MKKAFVLFLIISIALAGFRKRDNVSFVVPENWPQPQYNFSKNPLSKEKILLGRALFYDPILSRDSTISCFSCHSQYTAFTHVDHALSHGIDGRIGTRNSPALMNLAWHKTYMWDGNVPNLEQQAIFPITHPDEMGEKMDHVAAKVRKSKIYSRLFYDAFGDSAVTSELLLKAMSQFMLTLVSANARYDSVMRKETEFTPQEENGYRLFRRFCASCHTEPLFTNLDFENNGLAADTALRDYGRMKVTKDPGDSMKFKVPTLRNIEFSAPYMHDGRFKRLAEVFNHYTSGIQRSKTLSGKLQQPIVLSPNEKVDLTAFLLTLSDKAFLLNPDYSFPKNIFFQKPNDSAYLIVK